MSVGAEFSEEGSRGCTALFTAQAKEDLRGKRIRAAAETRGVARPSAPADEGTGT